MPDFFVVTERFVVKSKADAKGQSDVIASVAINVMNKLSSYANPDVNPVDRNRPEYNGILTPTKEWCTDSCGVFKLQLSLICPVQYLKVNLLSVLDLLDLPTNFP